MLIILVFVMLQERLCGVVVSSYQQAVTVLGIPACQQCMQVLTVSS